MDDWVTGLIDAPGILSVTNDMIIIIVSVCA